MYETMPPATFSKKERFEMWYAQVDTAIEMKTGVGRDDLPDCPYADWYDEGMTASRAAAKAIKLAGGE